MQTNMAASDDDGSHTMREELWSSLPNDLLSMVYARFASPFDRIRFAAVCASWRALASTLPPRPVLPWLMLDPRGGDKTKRVYWPDDGTVLPRFLVPSEDAGGCFIGGYHGGWVASSEAPLGIVNLLSGAEIVYSPEQRKIIRAQQSTGERLVMRKVVFSTAPTSPGCILAAITDKDGLALCSVGCPEGGWTTRGFHAEERLMDIAFCNGELYGLMRYRDCLIKFEIAVIENGAPVLTAVHRLTVYNSPPYSIGADLDNYARYIVELRGKLVMAVRRGCWDYWPHIRPAASFTVMQLVVHGDGDGPMDTRNYSWLKRASLGDHSLFLGSTCSMAVHVPESRCDGVKRNHIYYSHHRCLRRNELIPYLAKVFPIDNGGDRVHYKQDNSVNCGVERIPSVEYFVKGGVCPPTWILPPEI